jgi:DNA end-binding protein Ku
MPRACWRGFLRLSLVSCPVYLSPATTRTKSIRLHQVWRPAPAPLEEPEDDVPDRGRDERAPERQAIGRDDYGDDADESAAATRITIRPHDPSTGQEIDKSEVVKGYEYSRGQFVTFTREELKALDVESSKIIDLEQFVPRGDIDPVYFDTPYYLYPDGPIAVDTIRVIGAAMADVGVAGIGRLALSRRERMVMVEPRGAGMALFTLRAANEVRPAQFGSAKGDLDPEMVAIAGAIIRQRIGKFDPSAFRDRYQDALRQLIEAKIKGLPVKPRAVPQPAPVVDLMAELKRSLAKVQPEAAPRARAGKQRDSQDRTRSAPTGAASAAIGRSKGRARARRRADHRDKKTEKGLTAIAFPSSTIPWQSGKTFDWGPVPPSLSSRPGSAGR